MSLSTMITIPEMIDLALGSPEVGVVNFNILHDLLQVIVHQMDLSSTQVEFQGKDSDRIEALIQTAPPIPTIQLSEYLIPVEKKGDISKQASTESGIDESTPKQKTGEGSVEEITSDESGKEKKKGEKKSKDKQKLTGEERLKKKRKEKGEVKGYQTVVLVEPYSGVAEVPHTKHSKRPYQSKPEGINTRDSIEKIEKTVSQLQAQLEILPSNEEILNRVRTPSQTPVNDMWHILNLTKRMDAAEAGINKITSIVEELAKDTDKFDDTKGDSSLEKRVWELEHRLGAAKRKITSSQQITQRPEDGAERSSQTKLVVPISYEGMTTEEIIARMRVELQALREELNITKPNIDLFVSLSEKLPFEKLQAGIIQLDELHEKVANYTGDGGGGSGGGGGGGGGSEVPSSRLVVIEEKLMNTIEQINAINKSQSDWIENSQEQITNIEKELGMMQERLNSDLPVGDMYSQDLSGIGELHNKIQVLQTDMENMAITSTRLVEDHEEKELHMTSMLEEIEALKTIKADKEDLEDALAEKADQIHVNRKVSHDQFDAALEDMSRGLEDAIGKLAEQESIWQQAMDFIHQEIESKLDKVEISPLKEFVDARLKALQEKVRALTAMRRESEAAGTKLKILRNVNCISCDKDVVMKTELDTPGIPAPEALPPNRSMRPYLTYELDLIRRQQKRLPLVRNMLHFEEAMSDGDSKKIKSKGQDEKHLHGKRLDHLCNRYCGGSHTVTTAQQRVTRVGHFLTQWGPEAIKLVTGTMKGTDGQLYQAREQVPSKKMTEMVEQAPSPRTSITNRPSSSARRPSSEIEKEASPEEPPLLRSSLTNRPPSLTKRPSSEFEKEASPEVTTVHQTSFTNRPPDTRKSPPTISPRGSPPRSLTVTPRSSPSQLPKASSRVSLRVSPRSSPTQGVKTTPKGSKILLTGSPRGSIKGIATSRSSLVGSARGSRTTVTNETEQSTLAVPTEDELPSSGSQVHITDVDEDKQTQQEEQQLSEATEEVQEIEPNQEINEVIEENVNMDTGQDEAPAPVPEDEGE